MVLGAITGTVLDLGTPFNEDSPGMVDLDEEEPVIWRIWAQINPTDQVHRSHSSGWKVEGKLSC